MDWAMPHARMVGGANDDDVHAFLHTNIRTGRCPGQKPQSDIMTLLKHLNNEKSAHAETPAMRYPASQPDPTSIIPGHLIHTIIRPALLLILLLFSSFSALAYDCKVDGIYYNLNNDDKTASVTFYDKSTYYNKDAYKGEVVIPEVVNHNGVSYSVTSIGYKAFHYCKNLTSVSIPNSVTIIGGWAFDFCEGLTSVTIPASITSIGISVFNACEGLTSVSFNAEKCTEMGTSTNPIFYSCSNLTTLTIGENVTIIPDYAFDHCTGLTSVSIGESVAKIGDRAFYYCTGLSSVKIPNSVTSIGRSAFDGCIGLTSVTIPSSVTSIGGWPFAGCSGLDRIVVDADNKVYDSRNECNAIINTTTNELIAGCKNTIIPNSVVSIGARAFEGCSGLTSVNIPNAVISIGYGAFAYCPMIERIVVDPGNKAYDSRNGCNAIISSSTNKLIAGCKNTNIPGSVTSIDYYAFEGCVGLTYVDIPNSVTEIKSGAFRSCTGLTTVTIPNSVTCIGMHAFMDCTSLASVDIPNSVTAIEYGAFSLCVGLTSVTIGNSVTTIGEAAFYGCSGLTSVVIPNTVISIGDIAFYECKNLTTVTIGNSVTSIGEHVFYGCIGLTTMTIPNSVTSIGGAAFYGCSGLTSVTIPNSVTSIGNHAFSGCSGLTSVVIPNSVTSIGGAAFRGCSGLTKLVSWAVEPPTCGEGVFEEVDKTACQLLVPEESVDRYKIANQWEEFMYILGCSGVDDVSVDSQNAVYEVYNLQGVRVGGGMREEEVTADVLPHGVYILVSPQGRKKIQI